METDEDPNSKSSKMILFEANAGTGKTFKINTLILEGLLKKNYLPEEILATTFTVKGASEIRNRLINALKKILKKEEVEELKEINVDVSQIEKRRIIDIFNNVDKLFIGTIHSWCLRFLKIFPNKVNLPPYINVDEDKSMRDYYFEKEWNVWLPKFIRENPHLLTYFKVEDIKSLAKELLSYSDNIWENESSCDEEKVFNSMLQKLKEKLSKLSNLKDSPYKLTYEEKLVYDYLCNSKRKVLSTEDERLLCDYIYYDNNLINNLVQKIGDLIRVVKDKMLSAGYVDFESLLTYTKDILKNDRNIRNEVKNKYKLVLVDEGQDTSPVQYEIIFYICEKIGEFSSNWEKLNVEPGKLVIVGDPKQSIYGFRGADLKAYKEISKKAERVQHLTGNTRSCKNILSFTNDVARVLFEDEGIECAPSEYFKKHIKKIDNCEGKPVTECVKIVNLQFDKIKKYEKVYKETLWIVDDIKRRHKAGRRFKDFAILLRKIQKPFIYIDVLTKNNIPFAIESDRYFYQTQEVIDFINLLNFIIDPQDKNTLAGLLRSPIFSYSDYELVRFFRNSNKNSADLPCETTLRKYVFDKIKQLHKMLPYTSFSNLINTVLKEIPVLELLQLCYKKETVPFNILRFWQNVSEYELSHPQMGIMEFKRLLISNCRNLFDIGQEPLFDEKTDAVKILSIHKSKGLEFPVVYLPCIDVSPLPEGYKENDVIYDWVDNKIGVRCSRITNKNYLELKYIENIDEKKGYEEKRVFYVGITRAMEELVITYSEDEKNSGKGYDCCNILNVIRLIKSKLSNKYKFEDIRPPDVLTGDNDEPRERLRLGPDEVNTVLQKWQKIKSITSDGGKNIVSVSELLEWASTSASISDEDYMEKSDMYFIGAACHYVLSKVDFNNLKDWMDILERWITNNMVYEDSNAWKKVYNECEQILASFFNETAAYLWLRKVKILGREVPILYREDANQIIVGRIDILTKLDDKYYIVDYKTTNELSKEQIKKYGEQLRRYKDALDKKRYNNLVRTIILLKNGRLLFLDD